MLKIPQARLQQYVNRELPDVQAGLEKAEEPEIKLPTSAGSSKKQESSRKTSISVIDYAKASDCVDHNKLWKILKEMGIPDHLTCLSEWNNIWKRMVIPHNVMGPHDPMTKGAIR